MGLSDILLQHQSMYKYSIQIIKSLGYGSLVVFQIMSVGRARINKLKTILSHNVPHDVNLKECLVSKCEWRDKIAEVSPKRFGKQGWQKGKPSTLDLSYLNWKRFPDTWRSLRVWNTEIFFTCERCFQHVLQVAQHCYPMVHWTTSCFISTWIS